jgi:hypothetical protein
MIFHHCNSTASQDTQIFMSHWTEVKNIEKGAAHAVRFSVTMKKNLLYPTHYYGNL